MECSCTLDAGTALYLKDFYRKVAERRIPFSGSIELTRRCNLDCVHCYLGPGEMRAGSAPEEVGTSRMLEIADEITEAGCLNMLITGGEPFLRKDFPEIYGRMKANGLLVTVFSNGTLVNDGILRLFRDMPPHTVEISLYGATAETYEKITRLPGSFEMCMEGIRRLMENRVYLRLKTVLMNYNSREFFEIENFAKKLGVKFRMDAAIFPCFNGDKSPLGLRVSPAEAVEMDFSDIERARSWAEYYSKTKDFSAGDSLYNCGAGRTSFHIDSAGLLKPCMMNKRPTYDLLKGDFIAGWRGAVSGISEIKAGGEFICANCDLNHVCGYCPSFFELENGDLSRPSEYVCSMGKERLMKINQQSG